MKLDLSFAHAALVLPKEFQKLNVFLIGAGGTGSFAAMNLARVLFEITRTGKATHLTIIDPDVVESGNIPRSNFCAAEIGRFKAQTLAERITFAWGLEVSYSNEKLEFEKHLKQSRSGFKELTVLVGCVDNHLARRELHRSLEELNKYNSHAAAPDGWWIDGGNGKSSGQVLIGSETKKVKANEYFTTASIAKKLPAPSVIHPELLENQEIPAKREALTARLSCAEMIRLGEQSLNINGRVAIEIGQVLTELLLTNSLRRFATYFDLESGTSRSNYSTPTQVSEALQLTAVRKPKAGRRRSSGNRT